MKNEKNYAGFLIIKIYQILKSSGGTKTLAKAFYFWGVPCCLLLNKRKIGNAVSVYLLQLFCDCGRTLNCASISYL